MSRLGSIRRGPVESHIVSGSAPLASYAAVVAAIDPAGLESAGAFQIAGGFMDVGPLFKTEFG